MAGSWANTGQGSQTKPIAARWGSLENNIARASAVREIASPISYLIP